MPPKSFLDDYVPVNERIAKFYEKHPDGRIVTELVRYVDSQVVVKAYIYRQAADELPAGVGHSQMTIPGKMVANGAELETTETSAVGRALALAGFEVKRSVASREEVRKNLKEGENGDSESPVTITPSATQGISRGGRSEAISEAQLHAIRTLAGQLGIGTYKMTKTIADALNDELVLDADPTAAARELREYLEGLSGEDAGRLITYLNDAVERAAVRVED